MFNNFIGTSESAREGGASDREQDQHFFSDIETTGHSGAIVMTLHRALCIKKGLFQKGFDTVEMFAEVTNEVKNVFWWRGAGHQETLLEGFHRALWCMAQNLLH